MAHQFKKHYTLEEARALLPQIRLWLDKLARLRGLIQNSDGSVADLLEKGHDIGGELVNRWMEALADFKTTLREFQTREIQVKDLERGLIDFPAFIGGQEAFLCWEKDEVDIEYWHDLNSGYAGRERL
jgi:hypothetical protein